MNCSFNGLELNFLLRNEEHVVTIPEHRPLRRARPEATRPSEHAPVRACPCGPSDGTARACFFGACFFGGHARLVTGTYPAWFTAI